MVVSSENAEALATTLAELGGEGERLAGQVADVRDLAQVEALATLALDRFGALHCWINNAGTTAPSGDAAAVPLAIGTLLLNTNILGTYHGSVVAVRHFRRAGAGRLINLVGRGETGPVKGAALYGASKAWVRNFTLAMAKDEAGSGIEIGTFNPGLTLTDLTGRPAVLRGNEAAQLRGLRIVLPLLGSRAEESGASLARLALRERPIARENQHRRLLPRVLGRLLTGRRADIDVEAIAPRVVEPEA